MRRKMVLDVESTDERSTVMDRKEFLQNVKRAVILQDVILLVEILEVEQSSQVVAA